MLAWILSAGYASSPKGAEMFLAWNRWFPSTHAKSTVPENPGTGAKGSDDYPWNGFMNTIFPINAVLRYNISSPTLPVTTNEVVGRYASFSNIVLKSPGIIGDYVMFEHDSCFVDPEFYQDQYEDKIIMAMRGGCTFVSKVKELMKLKPRALIIGNNEPHQGLLTMFSNTFNQDGAIRIPMIFITMEDYMLLENEPIKRLEITTSSFGSLTSVILSATISPPLLVIFIYVCIRCAQYFKKINTSRHNFNMVKKLPTYIFEGDHLVNVKDFKRYQDIVERERRKENAAQDALKDVATPSSTADEQEPMSSRSSLSSLSEYVPPIPLSAMPMVRQLNVLFCTKDYYATSKCSICLDKFVPHESQLLVLKCKHIYHKNCLSNWLINFRRSCPLCNNTITASQLRLGPTTDEDEYLSATSNLIDMGAVAPLLERQAAEDGSRWYVLEDDQRELGEFLDDNSGIFYTEMSNTHESVSSMTALSSESSAGTMTASTAESAPTPGFSAGQEMAHSASTYYSTNSDRRPSTVAGDNESIFLTPMTSQRPFSPAVGSIEAVAMAHVLEEDETPERATIDLVEVKTITGHSL